jgi:hypothetical protein
MVNVPISKWTKRKTVFRYENKGRTKPSRTNITFCNSISMVAGYDPSNPWEDIYFLYKIREQEGRIVSIVGERVGTGGRG